MKVKCIHTSGEILIIYDRRPLGTSEYSQYNGQITLGREYLVMGMVMKKGYLNYLVDDGGVISVCPYQLFEIINHDLPSGWHFNAFTVSDENYINREALWGYRELCFVYNHYEQLIDMNEEAHRIYYQRKIQMENELYM